MGLIVVLAVRLMRRLMRASAAISLVADADARSRFPWAYLRRRLGRDLWLTLLLLGTVNAAVVLPVAQLLPDAEREALTVGSLYFTMFTAGVPVWRRLLARKR